MFAKLEAYFSSNARSILLANLSIFFVLFAFFSAFHTPGHIVFGDLDFGFVLQGYLDRIAPLWNTTWSTATFFNGTRLPFAWLVYLIVQFVTDNASFFEKSIIFVLLFLSGSGMFLLVSQILRLDKQKRNLPIPYILIFCIALGSALYYAFNPWSIMRIQHIYLLVGYAFLPFIFFEVLHLTENIPSTYVSNGNRLTKLKSLFRLDISLFRHLVTASALFVFAIGAVHYLFFGLFFIGSWFVYRIVVFLARKDWERVIKITYYHALFWAIFLCFVSYWLMPYIGASSISSVNPPSINTMDSISNLARYSTFLHVLYLMSYWWPMMDIGNLPLSFWMGGGFILWIILVGNLMNLSNKYVAYFFGMALLLIILGTGTKTPYFAEMYAWIVFENPLASQMGFIFRDANKIVGLLAFVFAVLWGTGIASGVNLLLKKYKNREKELGLIYRVRYVMDGREGRRINGYLVIFLLFLAITITSYFLYVRPFYSAFIRHFYAPIPVPNAYVQLLEYQKKDESVGKYLYMPRYETIISPGHQYAVTSWNNSRDPKRPTSSLDLYSTLRPTYNPLEGSTTYLGHLYEYLENYLLHGVGKNLEKYLALMNIWTLVYHADIVGLEKEQSQELTNLLKQDHFEKITDIGFFSIFSRTASPSAFRVVPRTVYFFGGLKDLETLFSKNAVDPNNQIAIFVGQDPDRNRWKIMEEPHDFIEVKDRLDLILSSLPIERFLAPFDFNNHSDAFSRWAKLREDVPDWKHHLRKLGIENGQWDFSWNRGFVFTYAPAMLHLEPYDTIHDKWEEVVPFSNAEDITDLFSSSDENNIRLVLEKTGRHAHMPAIKGEVFSGEGKIWRAGVMRPIWAREKTAYAFEVTISGKGVNNIHGKVKFLDEKDGEVGVDYVSAPRYLETFDKIKFSGNFITPPGTAKMVFELNTLQRPGEKSYWWIHDMQVKDLGAYTKPNTMRAEYDLSATGDYRIFTRAFHNMNGGEVRISFPGFTRSLLTRTNSTNKFAWKELGSISVAQAQKISVEIENISWFNAVNLLAFVREEEYQSALEAINKNEFIRAHQILAFEAEHDFQLFGGNIQSTLFDENLSNGKSVNLRSGSLETGFDIVKSDVYQFDFLGNPYTQKSTAPFSARLITPDGREEKIHLSPRSSSWVSKNMTLSPGQHRLILSFTESNRGMLWVGDFRRFDKRLDQLGDPESTEKPEDEPGCSYSTGLSEQAARYDWASARSIYLREGFSCYWLISTHTIIDALPDEEYLVNLKLQQFHTKNFHAKIRFLDAQKKTIQTEYYDSYENDPAGVWIDRQQIITTPPKTAYMQIQFWQKQPQDRESRWDLQDVFVHRYRELPGLDSLLIHGLHAKMPFSSTGISFEESINETDRKIVFAQSLSGGVLQMHDSYSPFWQARTQSGHVLKHFYSNLFLNGYILPEGTKSVHLSFVPQKYARAGRYISLIALISVISIFLYVRFRRKH